MIKIGRRIYTLEEYERGLREDWTHDASDRFWAFWGAVIAIASVAGAFLMLAAGFR